MNSTNANGSGARDTQPVKSLTHHINNEILSDADGDGKRLDTLRARFALLGHSLAVVRSRDDGVRTYLVSRWSHSRSFNDVAEAENFLIQIGGER